MHYLAQSIFSIYIISRSCTSVWSLSRAKLLLWRIKIFNVHTFNLYLCSQKSNEKIYSNSISTSWIYMYVFVYYVQFLFIWPRIVLSFQKKRWVFFKRSCIDTYIFTSCYTWSSRKSNSPKLFLIWICDVFWCYGCFSSNISHFI
jgi:hypothetical protein